MHPPSDSQADVFSEIQPLIVSLLDGSASFTHNYSAMAQNNLSSSIDIMSVLWPMGKLVVERHTQCWAHSTNLAAMKMNVECFLAQYKSYSGKNEVGIV